MLVSELLREIDSTTQDRVKQTIEQWRRPVQEALKAELRMGLSWRPRDDDGENFQCSSPVSLDRIGAPTSVTSRVIPPEFELAAKLSLWIPSLKALREGARDTTRMLAQYGSDLGKHIDVPAARQAAGASHGAAEALLRLAAIGEFDPVAFLFEINEDVLGRFEYNPEEGVSRYSNQKAHADQSPTAAPSPEDRQRWYEHQYATEIFIYWGVIGLISKMLGVSVEGLTVVVLAHELGHAYTHLGFDRDGLRWTGAGFARSEHALKEGLAQFYASRVCTRLSQRMPGATIAYEALLPKQPPAYHTHVLWMQKDRNNTEAIAATLAHVRRRGAVGLKEFEAELVRTSKRLRLEE
jgi:hypothetical protein